MYYKHQPLPKSQIRILHLDTGKADGELQCCIEHVEFPGAKYVALSYPWGGDQIDYHLAVRNTAGDEEGVLPLTENLHNALKDLMRSDVQPKRFWIDQICIDQKDLKDKEAQVKRMGDIYRQAMLVVTYAGPESRGDEQAISLLDTLSVQYITPFWTHYLHDDMWKWLMTLDAELEDDAGSNDTADHVDATSELSRLRHRLRSPLPVHKGWEDLLRILLGSWARRRWMVQENVLNPKVLVLRGGRTLDQRTILILCGFLHFKL